MNGADFRQQQELEEQEQQETLEWYLENKAKFDEIFGAKYDERFQDVKQD